MATDDGRDVSPSHLGDDDRFDRALRPRTFGEYVGQQDLVDNLKVFVHAANKREEAVDHILFCGPPGLGKTTLAHIIAAEMDSDIIVTSGPAIERKGDLAGIAPTNGPGLVGCLLVGISTAKGLAMATGVDLVGVHHIEGHLFAGRLACAQLQTPFLALVASGGHTDLIRVSRWGDYTVCGCTRDDAAGEAFDKVAKLMGLLREGETTMGGPRISAMAEGGDPAAFEFPRAFLSDEGFEFSFSGLKTSVLYKMRGMTESERVSNSADIAASFQKAVVDVLVTKTLRAAGAGGVSQVLLTGGVAANRLLRKEMTDAGASDGISVFYPPRILCTDNAAMIARAGSFRLATGPSAGLDLNADPRLNLC